jgi:hypothetical protein
MSFFSDSSEKIEKSPKTHRGNNYNKKFPICLRKALPEHRKSSNPPSGIFCNIGRMSDKSVWSFSDNSSIGKITGFPAKRKRCPRIYSHQKKKQKIKNKMK